MYRFNSQGERYTVTRMPKEPNNALREARLRQPSTSGSGRAMSRQELAEAINSYLYTETGQVYRIDANHVGKFEQGVIRWPTASVRTALRAILGARTDRDLGFHSTRQPPVAATPPALPEPPQPTSARIAPIVTRTAASSTGLVGVTPPMVIALPSTAVSLMITTDASGTLQIVIETAPPDVTTFSEPTNRQSGEARVVSIQRPRRAS